MKPFVVDISHHNTVIDFGAVKAAGIVGVIHKASQGRTYRDPDYAARRKMAVDAGLLWGAYHFNTGDNVKRQVDLFLDCAKPDNKTLLVLDYEDNRLSQMSIEQVVEFLHDVETRIGQRAAIYSGNRIKQTIGNLGQSDRNYVTSHRLWLCQYGQVAILPKGFSKWWLWQFTGDGIGPQPHSIPGIAGNGIDLNTYAGTSEQLIAEWPGRSEDSLQINIV